MWISACVLALMVQQPRPPLAEFGVQMQARNIRSANGGTARGLTLYVPRDAKGQRYYFSESLSGDRQRGPFAYSSIESWSSQSGRPIGAVYRMESNLMTQVVQVTSEPETLVLDETVTKPGEAPTENHIRLPITKGATWQLSQFHPRDLFMAPGDTVSLAIVDPIAKKIDAAKLIRYPNDAVKVDANVSVVAQRYQLLLENRETKIFLSESGEFGRSEDSDGTRMTASPLMPDEQDSLLARALRVLRRTLSRG